MMHLPNSRRIRILVNCLWFGWLLIAPRAALGGGGPENVLLVVNPTDPDSLTIANHYASARQIPNDSLVMIPWDRTQIETDIETFQQKILNPVLNEIKKRNRRQIDYIVYSAGFPYAVSFEKFRKSPPDPKYPQRASLTGLTYLHEIVGTGQFETSEIINRYVASSLDPKQFPSRGFRAEFGFDNHGERVIEESASHYYMSMVLGFTSTVAKNSVPEVLAYLEQAVQADGTHPDGTFYYVQNQDIRSKVRHDRFPDAVKRLQQLRKKAEIQDGILPQGRHDILGLTVGRAIFDWPGSNNRIVPGAICENFTSFGGVLNGWNDGQSLLLEFLSAGASASCGSVSEPHAIWQKFPHPMLHVHYAQGCSAAESFYQSIASPYQLLLVGDPLCQPWADPPMVKVTGIDRSKVVHGQITCKATSSVRSALPIRYHWIYLDGQFVSELSPLEPIQIDSTKLYDGYHELRVVAVVDDPVETQGRAVIPFVCHNPPEPATSPPTDDPPSAITQRPLACQIAKSTPIGYNQPISVQVNSPGASQIRLYRGRQELGRLDGETGKISIEASQLGGGPVTIQAVALSKSRKPLLGIPVKLEIPPPLVVDQVSSKVP